MERVFCAALLCSVRACSDDSFSKSFAPIAVRCQWIVKCDAHVLTLQSCVGDGTRFCSSSRDVVDAVAKAHRFEGGANLGARSRVGDGDDNWKLSMLIERFRPDHLRTADPLADSARMNVDDQFWIVPEFHERLA